MGRFDLTDRQWERLEPLLPPRRPRTGRPNEDHRRILNGIVWVLRTGAPWRDLPERYGPVGTVSSRFYRWRAAGVWQSILAALQAEADANGEVDGPLHFGAAPVARPHQPAAGARRSGEKGGCRTRRSAAPEAASRPRSTCGPRAMAGRSRSSSPAASGTSRWRWRRCSTPARSRAGAGADRACAPGGGGGGKAPAAPKARGGPPRRGTAPGP